MTATIPNPREILTSLITSLASIPIADNATAPTAGVSSSHKSSNPHISAGPASNPFRRIPPAYRSILTTLHVLYPSTLLPALDLLDRRLVTRVILKQDAAQHSTDLSADKDVAIDSAQEPQDDGGSSNVPDGQEDSRPPPLYHLVRSAQPQSQRRHPPSTSVGQAYVVRLESWNCTCAAFAFSAFPPLPSPVSPTSGFAASGYQILPAATLYQDTASEDVDTMDSSEDATQTWEFGGLSADGKDGVGGVPCCKHLLACVLVEKCSTVLGGYVEERLVGREDAAGLVGEI